MLRLSYNPFQKNLEDIVADDLDQLRQVAEGWYVEYKGTVVSTRSIAKSLAAFANHYGGWILYGVEGARDGSNLASAFPGLDKTEMANLIENIRNAAKDLVNPSPYFEYKVVDGPCADIGLLSNRSIVVVAVPNGINTPYVHGDGRIYRRIADASDPKPENDRFILDQLWERKRKAEKALATLLKEKPITSKGEKDNSFMHVFLLQDPTNPAKEVSNLNFDKFVEIMSKTNSGEESFVVSFDNFFTMSDGFVARHVFDNDPYNLVLTWKHYDNGSSLISVPLRKYPGYPELAAKELQGYKHTNRFVKIMQAQRHRHGSLIDYHMVILLIASFLSKHILLIKEGTVSSSIYTKVALENIWRSTPFVDTESYMTFIERCGLPVVQDSDQLAPVGTSFDSLIRVEHEEEDGSTLPAAMQLIRAAPLIAQVGNAFGIPSRVLFPENLEWFDAVNRSLTILRGSINELLDTDE